MWTYFWEALLFASVGSFILRLGGRKSISQMTVPQMAIIISLGTVLGGEVAGKGIGNSIVAAAAFIGFLLVTEWITLRWNGVEKLMKGEAIPVISEGKLLIDNLKTLRISVDDLEKRLRMAGINRIEDVQIGTIENNGELGYSLMPHARPVTMGDLEQILKANFSQINITNSNNKDNIFNEVIIGKNSKEVSNQLH
ncbi:DUF421 domain-containing protein [Bacillus sp. USDA818B3_A]|uniref:DUF421 domain-containing protein n=1 Tax=Bacillus sp. USDA818B3_A TaxID=2698834 RepID=UPI00136C5BFF|nr:YetF domain-containing protein [Bacillus sp. USDA818B3_A]